MQPREHVLEDCLFDRLGRPVAMRAARSGQAVDQPAAP
jgi:hypothetical protein